MTTKWTRTPSDSGILRKSEFKEKKEELFVFGYSCKLFRDDAKALLIDQGKHLIPWMGDETLKIDRYDARGALHELSRHEAPPGGYDWRLELTKAEYDVEQLCDEERFRALHTDEDEELMYKEEELKRLHAAGYGQVGFNYDTPAEPKVEQQPVEIDEPFVPTSSFEALFQHDITFPDTQKQNAIIEKTAKFIATQGVQMEILIKAKQGDNPQFKFLNKDDVLHQYYTALIALVKADKWPEKEPEVVEEKPHEPDEYLHPSLASAVIESAPSIPSIHYKPSADCDYTMLISKMRCEGEASSLAPGELPPPGTEPMYNAQVPPPVTSLPVQPHVLYQQYMQYSFPPQQYVPPAPPQMKPLAEPSLTGLSLMKHYGSGTDTEPSDSEDSSSNDKPPVVVPPNDVMLVIEKMSTYVARNGDEFADIVRAKKDPRFMFLDPSDVYHPYYNKLMREKRGEVNGNSQKTKPPVSFSIKKMKEPDPILPKPALPYESSSDEDTDKQTDKQTDNTEETKPVQVTPQLFNINTIPQAVIYKMEGQLTQNLPTVKTIEHLKPFVQKPIVVETKEAPKLETVTVEQIAQNVEVNNVEIVEAVVKEKPVSKEPSPVVERTEEIKIDSPYENKRKEDQSRESENRDKDDNIKYKRERKRHKDRREYRSKSETREKRSRSREREKRKEKDRDGERKRRKVEKDELESEIISLEDNSNDMIDLTGDQSDSKGEGECEAEKAKQMERRRRAAEFLKKVGVDPAAAALPTNSLASAMVDTLESIQKKKAAEEQKRRRKEKRRRREKREYEESEKSHRKSKRRKYKSTDDTDESDYESSKKKKRKKDKKTAKKKRKRYEVVDEESGTEEDQQLPANMDLSSTLKELRTKSPTKDLILPDIEDNVADESSSSEDRDTESFKKKKGREYSEGEWSSDSEADSRSSAEVRRKTDDRYVEKRSPLLNEYQ